MSVYRRDWFNGLTTFRQLLYTYTQVDNIVMAQSSLLLPLLVFVTPPSISLLLIWKPSFGVMRSRPPWPQVALKLTSPSPSPPHSLPIPNSQHPRSIVRLTKATSRSRLLMVRNNTVCLKKRTQKNISLGKLNNFI